MRTYHPLLYIGAHKGNGLAAELTARGDRYDRAIAVEASPLCAAELRDRFGPAPWHHNGRAIAVEIVHAAAVGRPGEQVVRLNLYGTAHGSASLGTITPATVERLAPFWEHGYFDLRGVAHVPAVYLPDLLRARGIDALGALVTDAQGADLAIAKTLAPMLAAGRVLRLQAEVDHPDRPHYDGLPTNSLAAWRAFMADKPYRCVAGPIDGWDDPSEIQADIVWESLQWPSPTDPAQPSPPSSAPR